MNFNTNIAVIGLGLIGGSVAKRLTRKGYKVTGVDIDKEVCTRAMTEGSVSDIALPENALSAADLIILSIYPSAALDFVEKYCGCIKNGAILTDVVGIKQPLSDLCDDIAAGFAYVGGHPMAGKEVSGYDNSTENMFEGANYVITPSKSANEADILVVEQLAEVLGAGNIVRTTPREHDEIISYTSQLPHIIAVAMCETPLLVKHKNYTGGSFEDVTRVAKINESLWSELFAMNKESLVNVIDEFESSVHRIKQAIINGDTELLKEIFVKVRSDKELIDGERN